MRNCLISFSMVAVMLCMMVPLHAQENTAFKTLEKWNSYHNSHDAAGLVSLYGKRTWYYTELYSRQQILKSKSDLFRKYSHFSQRIGNVVTTMTEQGTRLDFDKYVVTAPNAPAKKYPSYIVIENNGAGWVIKEESDLITDRNTAARVSKMDLAAEDADCAYYLKSVKKSAYSDYLDIVQLYQLSKKDGKVRLILTSGDACGITYPEDGGKLYIESVFEVHILPIPKIVVLYHDNINYHVFLIDPYKGEGVTLHPANDGFLGMCQYKGKPALKTGAHTYAAEGGRLVYSVYYDLNGEEIGHTDPVPFY